MNNKERGKIIVGEGIDGCGKGTQTGLLFRRLIKESIPAQFVDFPQYNSLFGKLIGRYLKGEFGEEGNPYFAAFLFAADRGAVREKLVEWLSQGFIIVANRYATSNAAHQGGRISPEKREEFLDLLDEMEYGHFGIPKEDLVLFFDMPVEIASRLVEQKKAREYLGDRKKDIHESDARHLTNAREMYLLLASRNNNWLQINCCDENGRLLTEEEIHELVWLAVKNRIRIESEY